jgi:hypothetical protein
MLKKKVESLIFEVPFSPLGIISPKEKGIKLPKKQVFNSLTRKFNEGTLSKSNVLSTIKFLKRKYLK